MTGASLVAVNISVFSFVPRSSTTVTRQSVSTSAGFAAERFVFMDCHSIVWRKGKVQAGERDMAHSAFVKKPGSPRALIVQQPALASKEKILRELPPKCLNQRTRPIKVQ